MTRILIVTDAWAPQVNGVVRSLENVLREAPRLGVEIEMLTPASFRTVPLPTYREVRVALTRPGVISARIEEAQPDYIHIATEGPLGVCAQIACMRSGRPFTTSYHTRFPEYLAARWIAPASLTYALMRRFHNSGAGVMVATASLERELEARGFKRLMRWSRGVDAELFRPRSAPVFDLPRPIFLTCGRLAVEKNLAAFLSLDLPGSKVVVGDGPERRALEARFPQAHFTGALHGEALACAYASADVFVFPSLTDTFGIVLLEALASGLPVAAFPIAGPLDVIGDSGAGVLDHDLGKAALAALDIPGERARAHALTFNWTACARQFVDNVQSAHAKDARYARRSWLRSRPAQAASLQG
ncbi:Glycosyltransferase involved in cell wall bisynthesis [Rhizobiales bacterium GAS191]|nr:Glycosyltransferase involved in cell wall bisynthesis [Rhizobiales bacterium GAS113]SED00392.1 Glycosyltransferase involved in cell wall bisynthesis [Rhizobiales bacterium GAS191]